VELAGRGNWPPGLPDARSWAPAAPSHDGIRERDDVERLVSRTARGHAWERLPGEDVGILGIEEHMGDSRNLYVIGIEKMYVSL
jgi:hypothetical protein